MMHIVVLCMLVWGTAFSSASECPAANPESFQLGINGFRNTSGNWISQVTMEHNEDMKPWKVDVRRSTKTCSGSKSVVLVVTVSDGTESVDAPKCRPVISLTRPESEEVVQDSTVEGTDTTTVKQEDEVTLEGEVTTEDVPTTTIDPDYILIVDGSSNRYKFFKDKVPWDKAQARCEQDGAHLWIVNSPEEFQAVKNKYRFDSYIHSGFNDKAVEGEYVTVLGPSLESTGYVKWRPGKPEGLRSKNCGFVHADGGLGDQSCNDKEQSICEMELDS